MKDLLLIIAVAVMLATSFISEPASAASEELDVYVVYQTKTKQLSKAVIAKIPATAKIRKYNTDLLLLANYTAKQKVAGKLLRSDLIILVGPEARSIFGDALNNSTVIDIHDQFELEKFEFMPVESGTKPAGNG